MVEVAGWENAVRGATPPMPDVSDEIIRIHPHRIISWGIEPTRPGMWRRDVAESVPKQ
ncbi:MAG TPA: hypothetical protein VGP31_07930 [Planosporangium sp.]|jgi:pyridoxamine 5'-phosphate oxidase family protein|nr:hypothetical protein [Planosporangium sp.]